MSSGFSHILAVFLYFFFFFFNDTPTTEIYTLSLHDALPISTQRCTASSNDGGTSVAGGGGSDLARSSIRPADRKSTRLNSSHGYISYAVFCLKKKKKRNRTICESTKIIKPSSNTNHARTIPY